MDAQNAPAAKAVRVDVETGAGLSEKINFQHLELFGVSELCIRPSTQRNVGDQALV